MATFEETRNRLYSKKPEEYTIDDILDFVKVKMAELGDSVDASVNTKIQYKVLIDLHDLIRRFNNLEGKIKKNNPELLND